jgi:hypothetical protein
MWVFTKSISVRYLDLQGIGVKIGEVIEIIIIKCNISIKIGNVM